MRRNNLFLFLGIAFFSCQSADEIKYEQYLVNGERIYLENCSNCHQKKGEGLKDLYPPLNKSEYFESLPNVICIVKNGQMGPIVVQGKEYNDRMPAFSELYDLDLAQLATFMNKEFANRNEIIEPSKVKEYLKNCK